MNKKSVEKLQEAGYVFLRVREDDSEYIVESSEKYGEWETFKKFNTRNGCKWYLNDIVKEDKYLY